MKKGWEKKQLGELADLKGRIGWRGLTAKEYTKSGPMFLSVHSLNYGDYVDFRDVFHISDARYAESPEIILQKDDVLICKDGAGIGKVGIVGELPDRSTINSSLLLIRSGKEIVPKFLYRCLSSPYFQRIVNSRLNGATTPHLYQRDITEFPIVLPPVPEQQRIVGVLDEAFDGIATAKANAEKNLQNAGALFESHLNSVFTQREDCPVVPIGDVAEVFDGPHATPKTVDAGPVFLGISTLHDGKINLGETRHVTPEDFRRWTRRVKPETNDVVFSYETRLGQAAIIPEGLECCLGRRMGLVRADPKRLDPRFFVYQYISPPFRKFLDTRTVRGATVDRIALKDFPSFPIRLPSLAEQKRMANRFERIYGETQRLESIYEQKLAALEELKKSLLHQAFTGAL